MIFFVDGSKLSKYSIFDHDTTFWMGPGIFCRLQPKIQFFVAFYIFLILKTLFWFFNNFLMVFIIFVYSSKSTKNNENEIFGKNRKTKLFRILAFLASKEWNHSESKVIFFLTDFSQKSSQIECFPTVPPRQIRKRHL